MNQNLEYMRMDVAVEGRGVLAVVLADCTKHLTFPLATIRKAIKGGGFGSVGVVKDFLQPDTVSTKVKRDKNNRRRKCETIIVEKMDPQTRFKLESGR